MSSVYRCPACLEVVSSGLASASAELVSCPDCGALVQLQAVPTPTPDTSPPELAAVSDDGSFVAEATQSLAPAVLWKTLRQLGQRAPIAFAKLDGSTPSRTAERFAYLCSLIGLLSYFSIEWLGLRDNAQLVADAFAQASSFPPPDPERIEQLFFYGMVLSPVLALIPAHLSGGVYQAGLWFVGAEHRGYDVTYKVAAYGMAPMLLCVIPGIGWLLAPIWCLTLHWIGLAAAHRLSLFRAAFAALIPWFSVMVFGGGIIGKALLFWLYKGELPALPM